MLGGALVTVSEYGLAAVLVYVPVLSKFAKLIPFTTSSVGELDKVLDCPL
jgi:hypothetical protein